MTTHHPEVPKTGSWSPLRSRPLEKSFTNQRLTDNLAATQKLAWAAISKPGEHTSGGSARYMSLVPTIEYQSDVTSAAVLPPPQCCPLRLIAQPLAAPNSVAYGAAHRLESSPQADPSSSRQPELAS